MHVISSCVLQLREHKGRRILCRVKLDPSLADDVTDRESQSFNWMEKHHWQQFDSQLEHMFNNLPDRLFDSRSALNTQFQISNVVSVQVTNSYIATKALLHCLGHATPQTNRDILALDCVIGLRDGEILENASGDNPTRRTCDDLEYSPQPISVVDTLRNFPCIHYVPSKINSSNPCLDTTPETAPANIEEDRYSPSLSYVHALPAYTPTPISGIHRSTIKVDRDIFSDDSGEKLTSSSRDQYDNIDIIMSNKSNSNLKTYDGGFEDKCISIAPEAEKNYILQQSNKELCDTQYAILLNSQDKMAIKKNEKVNISTDGIDLKKLEKSKSRNTNMKFHSVVKNMHKFNPNLVHLKNEHTIEEELVHPVAPSNLLRRSNRKTTRRFDDYVPKALQTNNTKCSSPKIHVNTIKKRMEEYFGSEAESDDFIEKTPIKTAPKLQTSSSQLTSTTKKRKRRDKFEQNCDQKKTTWLSKKNTDELSLSPKKGGNPKSRTKRKNISNAISKHIVYRTPEETAERERKETEQMKLNAKMKVILEDLIEVPKQVKILSLNNMSTKEILDTFPKYKKHLDEIFYKLRSKPKVTGYNGINHYSVIELIDNSKQLKMMHKLGEVYERDTEGTSLYSMLFANAMMPEWLVNIFKDKYKFSHSEAISHLNEQQQYLQYMDLMEHE